MKFKAPHSQFIFFCGLGKVEVIFHFLNPLVELLSHFCALTIKVSWLGLAKHGINVMVRKSSCGVSLAPLAVGMHEGINA